MANLKTKQLEIISKEFVKPSSPTPPHLKTYKFSLFDQLVSPLYVPFLFFYPNVNNALDHAASSAQKSSLLKKSLSKTLTKYYPFAGRVTGDSTGIDCNDEGVVFVHAEMKNLKLLDLLEGSDDGERQNLLCPAGFMWKESCNDSCLIAIQVTFFDCGGITVSTCSSHKILDGCSTRTFYSDWAAMTRQYHSSEEEDQEVVPPPTFIAMFDHLPLLNAHPAISTVQEFVIEQSKCTTRKFCFDSSKIAKLKKNMDATPVEVVTAFIYKCATRAAITKNPNKKPSMLLQIVDMRGRIFPPFPRSSIGNFAWCFTVTSNHEEEGDLLELHELVTKMRIEKKKLLGDKDNILEVNEFLQTVVESTKEVKMLFDDVSIYRFSCITGKSFTYYETDFGWGKPALVRMADGVVKNTFLLFDRPNRDGIDAWVTLEEQDMPKFLLVQDLLVLQ